MANSRSPATNSRNEAWVIAVDMGYGHQRAAYPLKDIAYERIITANSDKIVTPKEKKRWQRFQLVYEWVSRMKTIPVIGSLLWGVYDRFQSISSYYPYRDLSRPTFAARHLHKLIEKGFMKSIIDYTRKEKLPFVSTFFGPALAAAHAGLDDVYCVVTDSDINRIWAPEEPKQDKLYYFTPTDIAAKRLMEYGVPKENIFFTGFPLPEENLGTDLGILRSDLSQRLPNLDLNRKYLSRYEEIVKKQLGLQLKRKSNHPLTLTFVFGGAGAQKEIGAEILKSLKERINSHAIRVNIIAGTRPEIEQYFTRIVAELGLTNELGTYVNIMCRLDKRSYFEEFNRVLRTTDVLWTKPSELSFYTALGLPIIIAPPLGQHEEQNKKWLITMGAGIEQENPTYVNEWLFDWIDKGLLAEAAWQGFSEAPRYGTYNIEKVMFSKNKHNLRIRY